MRFKSVVYAVLCLPLLLAAVILALIWAPAVLLAAWLIPGFAAFKKTSGKRSWNIASFHSPHSLTWRWLINLTLGSMFSRPRLYFSPKRDEYFGGRLPFVTFVLNMGFGGAMASTNNYGWQFSAWLFGVHVSFHQQKPMWYRDLYQRARDEADQLSGRLWVSDRHPHKVSAPTSPVALDGGSSASMH